MNKILKNESFIPAATALIQQAKTLIYISTFKIELPRKKRAEQLACFFEILRNRALGKIDVRILTNKQNLQGYVPHTNAHAINSLKESGIRVRCLQNARVCHAKMLIVDGNLAILGSHNLSIKSCRKNFEVSYLITDALSVNALLALYIEAWYSGKAV